VWTAYVGSEDCASNVGCGAEFSGGISSLEQKQSASDVRQTGEANQASISTVMPLTSLIVSGAAAFLMAAIAVTALVRRRDRGAQEERQTFPVVVTACAADMTSSL
jgi:hypothetical protein